ncbi:hypothetical protein ACFL1U_01370 [Patescibacteria group bacterium]
MVLVGDAVLGNNGTETSRACTAEVSHRTPSLLRLTELVASLRFKEADELAAASGGAEEYSGRFGGFVASGGVSHTAGTAAKVSHNSSPCNGLF